MRNKIRRIKPIVNYNSLDVHEHSQIYFPPGAYTSKQEKFRPSKEMCMRILGVLCYLPCSILVMDVVNSIAILLSPSTACEAVLVP